MIDIRTRIHDKFSLEFKVGYRGDEPQSVGKYQINAWVFIPYSLDVSSKTYHRRDFYRDIRTNIRLITPVFPIDQIVSGDALPLKYLEQSIDGNYEYHIKMFSAIFKSSLRDAIRDIILLNPLGKERDSRLISLAKTVDEILVKYRSLEDSLGLQEISEEYYNFFLFGDEFMCNHVEQQSGGLLHDLERKGEVLSEDAKSALKELIERQIKHKKERGYPLVLEESPQKNREIVFRRGVLKKYIESDLFLNAKKKRDGVVAEQAYLSLAAGVSMIFATVVAFIFQQKYGNFTIPLFIALVVSYMLKDRIKELLRFYYAHKRRGKYFDNKTTVSINDKLIGWSKEGFDFISQRDIPQVVSKIRGRSPLLEADNRYTQERVFLYRKQFMLDRLSLDGTSEYHIEGVNEIIRYNFNNFMYKTDNPEVPLFSLDKSGKINRLLGSKIYYINFVFQLIDKDSEIYKRYRIVFSRSGIKEIEELY